MSIMSRETAPSEPIPIPTRPPPSNDWPGAPVLVKFAPQLLLLQRARMMVTHGGLNTVLHCLRLGVPMVAVPITKDQPAIAARAKFTGAAELLRPSQFTSRKLSKCLKRVLNDPSYRAAAERIRHAMEMAGGAERGASIIEKIALENVASPREAAHA